MNLIAEDALNPDDACVGEGVVIGPRAMLAVPV